MELNDRDIIATDDLGRPVYGSRILPETKIETMKERTARRPDAWNCGVEPLPCDETKPVPGLKRRNPGLAFARAALPPRA